MNLAPIARTAAERALEIAEAVRAQAEGAGPSPVVVALPPRHRAAYDRLVDALNRLPRPAMAVGSLALVVSALLAPAWFSDRMQALSDMPEAMWWIIGAVVSLHYGSRFQDRSLDARLRMPPPVIAPVIAPLLAPDPDPAAHAALAAASGPNAALDEWRARAAT